jgi:hypothetical protein
MSKKMINKKRNMYGTMKTKIKVQAEIKIYKNKIQYINQNNSFNNQISYRAIFLFRTNSKVIKTYKFHLIKCNQRQALKVIHRTL